MSVYREFVDSLTTRTPAPPYSVILCGSAQWGDLTILRDGTAVSDIDLLVVGTSLEQLRVAAREIAERFRPFARADAPLFKVGLKLRLRDELTPEHLSINEVAALLRGRLLSGRPVQLTEPGEEWCRQQANLVVPTRLRCNASQQALLNGIPNGAAMRRYVAARTLLDLPLIHLRSARELGHSYAERVSRFTRSLGSLPLDGSERRFLQTHMAAALRTKRAPDDYGCGSVASAERVLFNFAVRCGVAADAGRQADFWQARRPLDVRDWHLRQGLA
jgi:hypothetical protein